MGYYDQDILNYYYYMASQFAIVRSLVLARIKQNHFQSHSDLYRRHDTGVGPGPGQR